MKKLLLLFIALFVISCEKEQEMDDPNNTWNPIERVEIEYFLDDVDYKLDNKNPVSSEVIEGVEFSAEFSSVAGVTNQDDPYFNVDFEGNEVLGKTLKGYMDFDFSRDEVDIDLDIDVEYSSFIVGAVKQEYELEVLDIPLDTHYIDNATQMHVSEFVKSGEYTCENIQLLNFEEENEQYENLLLNYACKNRAKIKVKVFYESYK